MAAISVGFFAPPPATTTSRTGSGRKRSYWSATLRAVNDVAVAIMSSSRAPAARHRAMNASMYSRVNHSRPVLLGGCRVKNGSVSISLVTASNAVPARASAPSRSYGSSGRRARVTASMITTPGPVSNARTALRSSGDTVDDGGTTVTLPMPPRFCKARHSVAWANSRASAIETSGAPWPPAATSRARKSAITAHPVRSAIREASPTCQVL